jgi:hypothetical protein
VDTQSNRERSLAQHAEELRSRTDAICRFSGGLPTFEEGIKVFRDYCEEFGFWMDYPEGVFLEPDAEGDEHQVWFADGAVIKLTHPNFFGLKVVYRQDEGPKCLPCEYFERWTLHNEIFGDDVAIVGAFDTPDGIRAVLVQRAIEGEPTAVEKIEGFFKDNGWEPFSTNEGKAWYDAPRSLVVSDTHQGNLIEMPDGVLAPIDFRIQKISGATLSAVSQMVKTERRI